MSIEEIHEGERHPTLMAISNQASEIYEQEKVRVTCPCGTGGVLRDMYRCYYCDVIFCSECADYHFE